jgi:3-oxoacid CoA-transferase A subunit
MSKGLEDPFEKAVRDGDIELEIYPMGTLAERFRAAGSGIPAFYIPTGVGSIVEEQIVSSNESSKKIKREVREIDGKKYILEYALKTDFSFIHAYTGDVEGNLRYRKTANNFNHVMAKAGKVTIAEVENLVKTGELKGDDIQTPGIYVNRIVQVNRVECNIGID